MLECSHIDNGFYRVSDRVAKIIARELSPLGRLPSKDMAGRVVIDGVVGWLTRTPYRYRSDAPPRGWVWALYQIDPRKCPSLLVR